MHAWPTLCYVFRDVSLIPNTCYLLYSWHDYCMYLPCCQSCGSLGNQLCWFLQCHIPMNTLHDRQGYYSKWIVRTYTSWVYTTSFAMLQSRKAFFKHTMHTKPQICEIDGLHILMVTEIHSCLLTRWYDLKQHSSISDSGTATSFA